MIVNIEDMDLSQISDQTLQAVLICLFTDAYVEPDELPAHISENRGWWGDTIEITLNDQKEKITWGSKLWLLECSKSGEDTAAKMKSYVKEALRPLIKDKIIKEPEINVEHEGNRFNLELIFENQPLVIKGL